MKGLENRIQRAEKASESQDSWHVDISILSNSEYSDFLLGIPGPGEDPREDEYGKRSRRLFQICIARDICLRQGRDFDRARFDNMDDDELCAFCEEYAEAGEYGKMRLRVSI